MEERALLVTVTEMWNAIGSTGRRVLVGTLGIKAHGKWRWVESNARRTKGCARTRREWRFFVFWGVFWDACTKGQGTCTETELPILRGAILQILQAHPFCLHENLQWLALKAKGACAESEL